MDDVMAGVDPALVAIAYRLREYILAVDPDATEQPRPGDRALHYGCGPRKMKDGYAYIIPQKDYVNLGFYHAMTLPDPEGLLEGTGKSLRHVKVRTLADADRPAVRDLLIAAVAERKAAAG
jgi:hypothetical protein